MAKSLAMCRGCNDDFYNGHNPFGVKRCWNFESAKVIERTPVGIWDSPPYVWSPMKILSCRSEKGVAFLKREDSRMCPTVEARNKLAEKWRRESEQSSSDPSISQEQP